MIELVLSGNTEAFEPLMMPYRKALLTMAYRLSQNWEEASELSQETLLRAFRYLRSFDQTRSFRNWLLQILVNIWRSAQKKKPPEEALREWAMAGAMENPAESHARSEIRSQLLACLDGLSPREREVFLLRDIEEMSVKETARALQVSPLSVRVRLSGARKKIRENVIKKFPYLLEERR